MTASIGDRMKLYERAFDQHFTPNSPVVIRVDGKAFHTLLAHAERPFDAFFISSMVLAAQKTSEDMHGFKLAYVQSDECTFCITDYDRHETQGWFDYSLNKIVSVTASMFTAYFNNLYMGVARRLAFFDARAFVIPEEDVPNVFVWRQRDWERNSVQMLARSHFSHKECHGKKITDLHEMLHAKVINWADLGDQEKNGTFVTRDGFVNEKLSYDEIKSLLQPCEDEEVVLGKEGAPLPPKPRIDKPPAVENRGI